MDSHSCKLRPQLPSADAEQRRRQRRSQSETGTGYRSQLCSRYGITQIDLLKIDVEGYELAVLQGATHLLKAGEIDYIVVEAGLMPGNPRFTPLPDLIDRLRPYGFWLVGVYEQYGCNYNQSAEFCNALFTLEKHLTRDEPAIR